MPVLVSGAAVRGSWFVSGWWFGISEHFLYNIQQYDI